MSEPGYYKTNPRALSLRGVARKWGLLRLPLTYLITRLKRSSPAGWMPMLWKDLECRKEDLSDRFWQVTAGHRQDFVALGFSELGCKKVKDLLNPLIRDNGGINYLDQSRRHFGQLLYNRVFAPAPISAEREHIIIAFIAVFGQQFVGCSNHNTPFDVLPQNEVVRVKSDDVRTVYQLFVDHLAKRSGTPQDFPDNISLQSWFDNYQKQVFEHRVQSGLFIKMTEAEVASARHKLAGKRA